MLAGGAIAIAQVTPDNTSIDTQVNQNGNVAKITGGQTRGGNLFHSFSNFSVPTGNEASFNNASNIANIFSRVTGGNISNIDGAIRANGSANLFLINPAGIIFGENARLDIGGSFLGSTSSSILFNEGEFSTDLENPPLLTVNAPIGLGFRNEPGDIVYNSQLGSENNVLQTASLKNIALVGGNVEIDGGNLYVPGGRIELGGLVEAGTVSFNQNGSLNFPQQLAKGNVSLNGNSVAFVTADGGGSISIDAQNLNLNSGSRLIGGIFSNSGSADSKGGDIVVNVSETISIDGILDRPSNSVLLTGILNQTEIGSVGDAGNTIVRANNLALTNGGVIFSATSGQGNSGNIDLKIAESITIDGVNANTLTLSSIGNSVLPNATGNAGAIDILANDLTITNGGVISGTTLGQRNSGNIDLKIAESITIDGVNADTLTPSGIGNSVLPNATGNAGAIDILANDLTITNGGAISASTLGQGNSGELNLDITELVTIDGVNANSNLTSIINNTVVPNATGNAGKIKINARNLAITNGGTIDISTLGKGNGGSIDLTIDELVTINGAELSNIELNSETITTIKSSIANIVGQNALGDGGEIRIIADNLSIADGGTIYTTTLGQANSGSINLNIADSIVVKGNSAQGESNFDSSITNIAPNRATGNAGTIKIKTSDLSLINDGIINTGNNGDGNAGEISIETKTFSLNDGEVLAENAPFQILSNQTSQLGGTITLNVENALTLQNNSDISAQALSNASGGNINIDAGVIVAFPDGKNDITASAEQGKGGNITINAKSLLGINEAPSNDIANDINASSELNLDGNVTVNTLDTNPIQGEIELPTSAIVSEKTVVQACQSNRESAAKNGFTIKGKGGIPPTPDLPLDSRNISIEGDRLNSISAVPEAIETSRGKIQPARGIKTTDSGDVILTAYPTSDAGDRFPARRNCG